MTSLGLTALITMVAAGGPDGQSRPVVSPTLNALDGSITNSMAIVSTTNGTIDAYGWDSPI